MIRTPLTLIPYLIAAVAVVAGLLWHTGDSLPGANRVISQGEASVGGPFTLTDQDGKLRRAADFRGRFMLVYFGYTGCPDICPATLAVMADAVEKLGPRARRIVPVFVSVDPERDTPGVLKAYLKAFGARFVGLSGDAKSTAAAARAYRVYYRKRPLKGGGYAMDHTSQIYLMGPDGKFVADYDATLGPDGLAEALKRQL
ncbi:MAG: SCO family protein [Alphaproteobacteria bacterium]|nr:SCO family protein [Alphaproteobacteria bacterium]MDE2630252.1 SCO family protein [Alphaproteobacteria bacterium]